MKKPIDSSLMSIGPGFQFDEVGPLSPLNSEINSPKVEQNESLNVLGLKRGFLGPFTRAKAQAASIVAVPVPTHSRSR